MNFKRLSGANDIISHNYVPHHEKTAVCICENKGADHLRSNRAAHQCFCFRYIESTKKNPQLPKSVNFKPLAIFCGCTAWFVLDLVRNPEDRFSYETAHI